MGVGESLKIGPFLLCLWKNSLDDSFSFVVVFKSFNIGVVRCTFIVGM